MPWRKLKLVHQILLLAVFALFILAGIIVLDVQRKTTFDTVIYEQEELVRVKNQLASIELEALLTRLDETQLVSERKEANFHSFEQRIHKIEDLSKTLQAHLQHGQLHEDLQNILIILQEYHQSVQDTLGIQ